MNAFANRIEELKSIQNMPRLYLADYFSDLKTQVDLIYTLNLNEKDKYIEIINSIESNEQESYKKIKKFTTFNEEIQSIEEQLNHANLNMDKINKEIDGLLYKIEKKIFSNKTIIFLKDYGSKKHTFLLILNNEYLRNKSLESSLDLEYLTREKLNVFFLKRILDNYKNLNSVNVLNLSLNESIIILSEKGIKNLHSNLFNDLNSLDVIHFRNNKIKEIHSSLFDKLANLKIINFGNNEIKELQPTTFNGLVSLKEIYFFSNQIKQILIMHS